MVTVTVLQKDLESEFSPALYYVCPFCKNQMHTYSVAKTCFVCHQKIDVAGIYKDVKKRIAWATELDPEPLTDL